jgi:hypothetical protein
MAIRKQQNWFTAPEEILAKYPWDTVRQKSSKLINKASEFLIEAKLLKKAAIGKKKSQQPSADLRHWATVASDDSLGSVLGWGGEYSSPFSRPKTIFIILCASRAVEAALETATPTRIRGRLIPCAIYGKEDEWLVCRRNGLRSAFPASKPRFLLEVLGGYRGRGVFSEPEVLFFRDPGGAVATGGTPCWSSVARCSDSQTENSRTRTLIVELFSRCSRRLKLS